MGSDNVIGQDNGEVVRKLWCSHVQWCGDINRCDDTKVMWQYIHRQATSAHQYSWQYHTKASVIQCLTCLVVTSLCPHAHTCREVDVCP